MIRKFRNWLQRRRGDYMRGYQDGKQHGEEKFRGVKVYTYEQLKNAYLLGHKDGRVEGLELAKQHAAKSFSEILGQQNK